MDGSSFNIFYYELSIGGINKDVAKWFIKTMAGAYICVTIESILNLSLNLEHPQMGLGQFA